VTRNEALAHVAVITAATPLPVNADLERGFGDTPEHAAQAVRLAVAAGAAGGSIEDATGVGEDPIYAFDLAVARVEAAVAAAREWGFVITARSENFLHGRPDLDDTICRLQAFEGVGADVLYAPGLPDLDAISSVCASLERPVNALADPRYSVAQLAGVGVTRISLGSRLSRAVMGAFIAAATEVAEHGTFTFATAGTELDRLLDR
jgi:2-methylisocitrate lyase-like PEP mutase family enzyme